MGAGRQREVCVMANATPFLSIVICVRNQWGHLSRCLGALRESHISLSYELLVVNDGSTHAPPADVMRRFDNPAWRYLRQEPLGIAAARNFGASEAKGAWLLFTDSDCLPPRGCLPDLVREIQAHPEEQAFQLRIVGDRNTNAGTLEYLRVAACQQKLAFCDGHIGYVNTAGFAIRKSVFHEFHGFDVRLRRGEDTDLLVRMKEAGIYPWFASAAQVVHSPAQNLARYCMKHVLIGYQTTPARRKAYQSGGLLMSHRQRIGMFTAMRKAAGDNHIARTCVLLVLLCYLLELLGRLTAVLACAPQRMRVLSVSLDVITSESIVASLVANAASGIGSFITYLTAWSLVLAQRDPAFCRATENADICMPDGMGAVLGVLLTRGKWVKKVTLHDFHASLFREIANRGLRLGLVGGLPGVAEQAAERIRNIAPGIEICCCASGYLESPEAAEDLRGELLHARPDVVLVGMSQPLQEKWTLAHRTYLPQCVFFCVGGFFEFITAREKPLPQSLRWMRIIGLEWLWRFVHAPKRLARRYLLGIPELLVAIACFNLKSALRVLLSPLNAVGYRRYSSHIPTIGSSRSPVSSYVGRTP
jgi:N-acetylglucosaminyldiphosphoundecaprenol N-acetyl-beta-D-mannosaminyltransferase